MKNLLFVSMLVSSAFAAIPSQAGAWMATYKCDEFNYRTEEVHSILGEHIEQERVATSWTLRTFRVRRPFNGRSYEYNTGPGRMVTCTDQESVCSGAAGFAACD